MEMKIDFNAIKTIHMVVKAVAKAVKAVVEATFDQTTAMATIQEMIRMRHVAFKDTITYEVTVLSTAQIHED